MRTYLILGLILCGLVYTACGKKVQQPIMDGPKELVKLDCSDTFGTVVFVNKNNVEQRVNILLQSSILQGNVRTNTYTKIKTFLVAPGDSMSQLLTIRAKFMYEVYGPVSSKVNGIGIVGEEKFELTACQRKRVVI